MTVDPRDDDLATPRTPFPATGSTAASTLPGEPDGTPVDRRRATMLLVGAAASLGLLFLQSVGVMGTGMLGNTQMSGSSLAANYGDVVGYLPLLAPLIALLAWQFTPARSAGWLLLVGALAAVPYALFGVAPELYGEWMAEPLAVLTRSAPAFTLIGLLAAATVVWQSGLRAAAASLIGTGMVIQLVGPVVIAAISQYPAVALIGYPVTGGVTAVLAVIFAVAALAGAMIALSPVASVDAAAVRRPSRRVTGAGCVAVLAQLLPVFWRPEAYVRDPREIGDYFLQLGLVYLLIAAALAALCGVRVLLAASAVGLLTGLFGMLLAPTVETLADLPVLAAVAGVVSILLAAGAALSPWRDVIGAVGLTVMFVGLVWLFVLSNSDEPYSSYEGTANTLTGILLVVGIVSAVCAIAAAGHEVAERADVPAVLAGLGTVFSLGAVAVVASFGLNHGDDTAPFTAMLPPVFVGVAVAAGLVLGSRVHRRAQAGRSAA